MKLVLAISTLLVLVTLSYQRTPSDKYLSDDFIAKINSHKTTWTAGQNFPSNTPLSKIKGLLGVLPRNANTPKLPVKKHPIIRADIPETFDAREAWPNCADTIGDIRDQASCGSCWAFGAVEAMSDRICIHSNATKKISISSEDLLDCCWQCGDGCFGGWPEIAWEYWSDVGIVTGGKYGTTDGCKAYSIKPCDHHVDGSYGPCGDILPTPECKTTCDEGVGIEYESDLTTGSAYWVAADIEQIQTELMTNGPLEADFDVYEDFLMYKSGVYQHVEGDYAGGHAIKILGWGVEDGTPYWLAANSWNEEWGDNGYFKILRGENECGIEADFCGGIPNL